MSLTHVSFEYLLIIKIFLMSLEPSWRTAMLKEKRKMKYRSAGGNSLNVQKSEHDDLTISGTNGKCKQSMFWLGKKVAFSCGEEDVRAKKNVLMNLISKHWTLMLAHFSFINYICVTKLCKINIYVGLNIVFWKLICKIWILIL